MSLSGSTDVCVLTHRSRACSRSGSRSANSCTQLVAANASVPVATLDKEDKHATKRTASKTDIADRVAERQRSSDFTAARTTVDSDASHIDQSPARAASRTCTCVLHAHARPSRARSMKLLKGSAKHSCRFLFVSIIFIFILAEPD